MPISDVTSAESVQPRLVHLTGEATLPVHFLGQKESLTIKALPHGCIYSIEHGDIVVNQVLASPLTGGIHRIYLRFFDGETHDSIEIVGPDATSEFVALSDRFVWEGSHRSARYRCHCWLPAFPGTWVFQIQVENRSEKPVACDAILVQDLGLATRAQVRNNERYTSQYLDHCAFQHGEFGYLLMTRQNLPQPEDKHPWLLQGCFPKMAGFTTDGLDFFGLNFKENGCPEALSRPCIGTTVRQHESGYAGMQASAIELSPGDSNTWAFFAQFSTDHPSASSADDIDDRTLHELQGACKSTDFSPKSGRKPARSVFQAARLFQAEDLDEPDIARHFQGPLRHEEIIDSQRFSFFLGSDSRHVVFKAKELAAVRPHGHIMRAGQGLMPDAEVLSCTCYAAGVFASQMAVGNTVFGKLLSGVRDPFNVVRSSGMRILMRPQKSAGWELLAVPSAFEMAPNFCRWYYKSGQDLLSVACTASDEDPAFGYTIRSHRRPLELLICGEVAGGPQEYDSSPRLTIDSRRSRISIRPDAASILGQQQPDIALHAVTSTPHVVQAVAADELVAPASGSGSLPYFTIRTHPTNEFSLGFIGVFGDPVRAEALCTKYESIGVGDSHLEHANSRQTNSSSNGWDGQIHIHPARSKTLSQLQDALAWFARDAIIHFSVPRGLEQAHGGAWGVRDVCQGPVEFFLARDRADVVREIITRLFSQQFRERGDWPQWFMFPPFQQVRSTACHGDVAIWPLKALCDYLEQTDDGEILYHELPYTNDQTFELETPAESILRHVDKLIGEIRLDCLPGLSLPSYGEGDWDDSLQPVSAERAERMVSSWTVALLYQTVSRYAVALERFKHTQRASEMAAFASQIRADYHRLLVPDGVVAGFAVFGSDPTKVDHYLLHPSDQHTGLRYRLISMSRGIISGIFTPEQAAHHLQLIQKHLVFPDGARLMDCPTKYRGGEESIFRRSESAAFFGREIGLQYVHAHLRYAEALAAMGQSEDLLHALAVVNPISVTEAVPNARPRQRNCYFSSSDAAFRDRYEASRDYKKLRNGKIPVDGGWRIYSSGPGIYTNLVIRHLLGLRKYFDCLDFDPVLPPELNGTCCDLDHTGRKIRYEFGGALNGQGKRILINGNESKSSAVVTGDYRERGIRIRKTDFEAALTLGPNIVRIEA
jgi:cellobiose phosphorylase